MNIQNNYHSVAERIKSSCKKANRNPKEINLIWVSKNQPKEKIKEALNIDANHLGENKIKEIEDKYGLDISPTIQNFNLHFIGHLQTNKAKKVLAYCNYIHSVDSEKLLLKINKLCEEQKKSCAVFFQLNLTEEKQKYGFLEQDFIHYCSFLPASPYVNYKGLMTMGPNNRSNSEIREIFSQLKQTLNKTKNLSPVTKNMNTLSAGMSQDFEIAIEEGSHYIRVGTELFK